MRHLRSRLRLKAKPAHARMMERNLATSVLLYESVRTTRKRAKVVQPVIDRLINYAKNNPPHVAIRHINKLVTDKNASRKIMEVYKDRYKNRPSGLSRIVPVGVRKGDGAELVDLTLVDAVMQDRGQRTEDRGKSSDSLAASDSSESSKKKSSAKKKS